MTDHDVDKDVISKAVEKLAKLAGTRNSWVHGDWCSTKEGRPFDTRRCCSKAAEEGLVVRKRTKDDARAYAVKPTTEGQHLLADAGATAMRTEEKLLSGLSANNRRDLIRLLRALADTASMPGSSK